MKYKTSIVAQTANSIGRLFFLIAVCVGAAVAQPDEQSVARMTELITARSESDNLYIQRGNIYLYLNRLAEALADAEKAFALNPKNSDVFNLRGQIKIKQQDNDGAIADLSRAIAAAPRGYPLAYLMRGELYEKKGDLPRAYADFKKLEELTSNPRGPQGIARLEAKMKAAGIDPNAPIPIEKKVENKEAWAAFEMADKFIKKLEWQAAVNEYGKAIALDPEFAAAYLNRAQTYSAISQFDSAIADYADAIRLKPDYAAAFESRGALYYIYNKPDLALADLTEAIRLVPNSSDAYLNRGRVYSKLNQNSKAVADWEKFLQLAPNSSNAELVRGYLAPARQPPVNNRQPPAANSTAESQKWYDLGVRQAAQKDYAGAVNSFSECVRLSPMIAVSCYVERGNSYTYLSQGQEAFADYTKAIELDPKFTNALISRGLHYYNAKKYAEAIADYTKAIEVKTDFPDAYFNRGLSYYFTKKYAEAINDYSKAIELNLADPTDAYKNRGDAYQALNKNVEAFADYSKAVELDPQNVNAYFKRGLMSQNQKKYAESNVDLTKTIELNPRSDNAYFYRGNNFFYLKRYNEAISDYSKAIELNPKYVTAYGNRAAVYIDLKKDDEALLEIAKALQINPKFANGYLGRSIVYCRQGKIALAQADEKTTVELGGKIGVPCR